MIQEWRRLSTVLVRSIFTFAGQRITPKPAPKRTQPVDVDAVVQAVKESEGIRVHHKGHLTAAVFGVDPNERKGRRRRRRWRERPGMGPRERYMFKKLRQRERQWGVMNDDPASDLQPLYDMMQPWMGYSPMTSSKASKELKEAMGTQEKKFSKREEAIILKIRNTIEASQIEKQKSKKNRTQRSETKALPEVMDQLTEIKTDPQRTNERGSDGGDVGDVGDDACRNDINAEEHPLETSTPSSAAAATQPVMEVDGKLHEQSSHTMSLYLNADGAERQRENRTPKVASHIRSSLTEQLATRIHQAELKSKRYNRHVIAISQQQSDNAAMESTKGHDGDVVEQALLKDPTFQRDSLKLEAESAAIEDVDEWITRLRSFAEQHGDVLEAMDEKKEHHSVDASSLSDMESASTGSVGTDHIVKENLMDDDFDVDALETEAKQEFEDELNRKPMSIRGK